MGTAKYVPIVSALGVEPLALWCGDWGRKTPGYPILFLFYDLVDKESFRYLCPFAV